MHILWGIAMVAAGALLLIGGRLKSEFLPYRLLVARSRILWGENAHLFHQITGGIVVVLGVLVAGGLF